MARALFEVEYTCSNQKCGHKQTIRYFPDDPILPVTCCMKCRAGFGIEIPQMMMGKGMFPGKKELVAW